MINHWDERYAQEAYAYGEEPNAFLQQELQRLTPGNILFPAEGEGRNAVFAARHGWKVWAFDQSTEGRKKALALADKHGVQIDYLVEDYKKLPYQPDQFDVIALIYAHFPTEIKSDIHKHLLQFLKPGGKIIFEAFSKKHLEYVQNNPKVGGPKEAGMLFSAEELQNDFSDFDVQYLKEEIIELSEGLYHNGTGSVMRFIGTKK